MRIFQLGMQKSGEFYCPWMLANVPEWWITTCLFHMGIHLAFHLNKEKSELHLLFLKKMWSNVASWHIHSVYIVNGYQSALKVGHIWQPYIYVFLFENT